MAGKSHSRIGHTRRLELQRFGVCGAYDKHKTKHIRNRYHSVPSQLASIPCFPLPFTETSVPSREVSNKVT